MEVERTTEAARRDGHGSDVYPGVLPDKPSGVLTVMIEPRSISLEVAAMEAGR